MTSPPPRGSPAARCPGCSTATATSVPRPAPPSNRRSPRPGYVVNRAARSLVTQRTGIGRHGAVRAAGEALRGPQLQHCSCRVATRRLAERDMSLVMMLAGRRGRPRARGALPARRPRRRGAARLHPRGRPAGRARSARSPPRSSCGAVIGRESVDPVRGRRRSRGRPADGRLPGGARAAGGSPRSPARWTRRAASSGSRASPTSSAARRPASSIAHGDYTQASGEARHGRAAGARPGPRRRVRRLRPDGRRAR